LILINTTRTTNIILVLCHLDTGELIRIVVKLCTQTDFLVPIITNLTVTFA
jgi:hypothetical protein